MAILRMALEGLPLGIGMGVFLGLSGLMYFTDQCKAPFWKNILVAAVLTIGGVGLGYTLREFIFWCLGWFGK